MIKAEQEPPLLKKLNFIKDLIKATHSDLTNVGQAIDLIYNQVFKKCEKFLYV